jgi:MscS family membrane protein
MPETLNLLDRSDRIDTGMTAMPVTCRLLYLVLISAVLLMPGHIRAATLQALPEIAADSVDIRSPRTTLNSLVRLTDTFQDLVDEEGMTHENTHRLRNINQQFEKLFDLREVPPKYRRHVAAETAVYLREALARFPLPPMEEIPDEDLMVARVSEGRAAFYQLPGTPVVIRLTEEGVYEGRYQFSQATVDEARNWYEASRELPYYPGQESVDGLFEAYFLTPGPLISHELIRALPGWMHAQLLDQVVWQWLMLVATAIVLVGLILLLHILVRRLAGEHDELRRNLVLMLWPIGVIYLVIGARYFLEKQVILSGDTLQDVLFTAKLIKLFATVYLVIRVGNVLTELIIAARQFNTRLIEQQLIRLGIRMLIILAAVVIVLEGMQQIGFSLATLVAGAGVTGLAIALAAQDALKNVFGGLLLALDRPFEVGQRVRMKGYEGFIQEVGLRSTRVRTLSGNQIIIPNEDAARMEVENIDRRPFIRRDLNVTITYDTPPEKISRAVDILRDILAVPEEPEDADGKQHPNEAINRSGYPPRVFFNDLNADSLNLLVVYWFHPPEIWQSVEFAHRINMQIMERFNAEGIDFAFPSQTMYLAGDSKRPINLGQPASSAPSAAAGGSSAAGSDSQPVQTDRGRLAGADIEETALQGDSGDSGGDTAN